MTSGAPNQKLVSSIRYTIQGGHAHITIWVRGGCAGTLVIDATDLPTILNRLAGPETACTDTTEYTVRDPKSIKVW